MAWPLWISVSPFAAPFLSFSMGITNYLTGSISGKGNWRGGIGRGLWLGPSLLDTKALESRPDVGCTLAGPVGLGRTKLTHKNLTHPIFRLLSYIWKMKVPSRPIYFFSARFRHFPHGRGNQVKAGGLLAEKREQKSWLIQCQCRKAMEAYDMPFTCSWTRTSLLAGWPASLPLAHDCTW